jgi:hypothetical protein
MMGRITLITGDSRESARRPLSPRGARVLSIGVEKGPPIGAEKRPLLA